MPTRAGPVLLTVLAAAVAQSESSGQNLVRSQWVQLGRPNRCPAKGTHKYERCDCDGTVPNHGIHV